MARSGWFYLHENGSLIYKRELPGTELDLRESTCVRAMWPIDLADRMNAWDVLIEARVAGCDWDQVLRLSEKWGCNDDDAGIYAHLAGAVIVRPAKWYALRSDHVLGEAYGVGTSALGALVDLAHQIGCDPSKERVFTFRPLLRRELDPAPIAAPPVSEAMPERVREWMNAAGRGPKGRA